MRVSVPVRRMALIALTGAVAATGVAVATRSADAAVVDTTASYVLVNRNSGKALDVYNLATSDGAPINQYTRNDGAWQQWRFLDSGGGWYRVQSVHSGKVLDLPTTADGIQLVQNADSTSVTSRQFRLADSAGGLVRLINRASGKALDVWEWSTADGARVSQYQDLDGANQQWQLVRLGSGPAPTTPPGTTPPPSGPTTPPAAYPAPNRVTGDVGVHDPTVVRRPEGGYLLANTGNGISLKTTTDKVAYRNAGAAFPNGTPWADTYTEGSRHLWAPDLSYHNGRYWLYYSASTFGVNRSAIFLATSTTGASGSWTNHGLVVESRTSDNFNAIDPNLLVDADGRWWLSFGSFWTGHKMISLDPSTGLRSGTSLLSIAGRNGGAIEAPVIVKRGQYYYQWVSFDKCCEGARSTYRIMVGRSTSPTGPYVDRNGTAMTSGGGTQVLAGHGSINGPGHQAVLQEASGDTLFYHYYAANNASLLGVNRIGYDSAGWPFVY